MRGLIVSQFLLWLAVLGLGGLCLVLLRQVGVLYERVAPAGALAINRKLKAGERAPHMHVPAQDGGLLEIGGPSPSGRSTLLFFLSPDCPVCKTLLPVLSSIRDAERGWLDIVLASDGDAESHVDFRRESGIGGFPYLLSEPLGRAFGVGSLPYAVLIDEAGTLVALGLVNNREHLESLFEARERGVATIQEYLRREDALRAARGEVS